MAVDPRNDPNGFKVVVTPPGTAWATASPTLRLRFYQEVGRLAAAVKDRELARGIDKDGRRLTPISAATREARKRWDYSPMGIADPKAPPLTPVYAESRTRSLLRWKAYADRVVFFWAYDIHTERPWGEILDYHRRGGAHLPVRDVVGISPKGIEEIRRQALKWWASKDRLRELTASPAEARGRVGASGIVAPLKPVRGDYTTGPRRLRNGRFEKVDITGKHIDELATVGAR